MPVFEYQDPSDDAIFFSMDGCSSYILQKIFDKEIELDYADPCSYDPVIRSLFHTAIEKLKAIDQLIST